MKKEAGEIKLYEISEMYHEGELKYTDIRDYTGRSVVRLYAYSQGSIQDARKELDRLNKQDPNYPYKHKPFTNRPINANT